MMRQFHFVIQSLDYFHMQMQVELFVYMGIATGIQKLGLSIGNLAVRYFIVGVIVILIRGILCEKIYAVLSKKSN